MSGRAMIQPTLASSARMPVRMKRSGSETDGAPSTDSARLEVAVDSSRDGARRSSTRADSGNETSIVLFLGFAGEAARIEQGVKVNRATVRSRKQRRAFGQRRERLQNSHHRLRRFEAASVHVHDFIRLS